MTKEVKTKIEKEAQKLTKEFYFNYGHTPAREEFFSLELPKFAEKILEKNVDVNKEAWDLIGEYKKKQLGGFNSTYGWLYNWLFDFAAVLLGVDVFELQSSVVYK